MTDQQRTWDKRVQEWLETLDPPLRAAAEQVVDEYLHPIRYEPIGDSDDWTPKAGVQYGITVPFNRTEIKLLSEDPWREINPIQLMKDMLLEHAREIIAERGDSERDGVAAD